MTKVVDVGLKMGPMLTPAQVNILRDVRANRIDINECSEWMRDQLVEIISAYEGLPLIDTQGTAVILTAEGSRFLAAFEQK